jgi:hypothetical protein
MGSKVQKFKDKSINAACPLRRGGAQASVQQGEELHTLSFRALVYEEMASPDKSGSPNRTFF